MDHRQYVHDAAKAQSYIREVEGDRLVTTKGLKIVIPVHYIEKGLAYVGIETRIVGIYGIIVEDHYYGVSMACAMMRITPSSTAKVIYDDEEFYEFTFDPGATICPSAKLVMIDTLVYNIYDEILSKGRVPWYLSYDHMGMLFDTAQMHAGANVGMQQEVVEMMVSLIARDPNDRAVYYRQVIQSKADLVNKKPVWVGMRSVSWSATNTLNKVAGSYAKDGMVSALVTPTVRVERIEQILRQ